MTKIIPCVKNPAASQRILYYSAKIRAFPHAREFYNSQAKAVANFCKNVKIKYHIKEGTVS